MSISSCDRDKERINYSIENMLAVNVQGIISIYIDEIPEAMFRLVKRGGVALNVFLTVSVYRICTPLW